MNIALLKCLLISRIQLYSKNIIMNGSVPLPNNTECKEVQLLIAEPVH